MSVLAYIEETNQLEVRELLTAAHLFLQETLPPFATCAIKWRIPFYSLRRNFCYLNRHRDHITLGFPHGYKLAPQPGHLLGESENLKHVRYLEIRCVEDLYSEETLQILHEAILLDEMMAKDKLTFRRKTGAPFKFPKLSRLSCLRTTLEVANTMQMLPAQLCPITSSPSTLSAITT